MDTLPAQQDSSDLTHVLPSGMTTEEVNFVYNAEVLGLPARKAASMAGMPVGRIVATMEEAFALLRAEHGKLPRAVNFISGPSRTGDIEQTIVLGAHGPCRVHLILVEENP